MRKFLIGIVFLYAFSVSLWGFTDWQRVIDKVSGSLVNVVVQESVDNGGDGNVISMGSGVIFKKSGKYCYFATTNVNLEGLEYKKCYAVLPSGQQILAKLVGKNKDVNLAVYRISPKQNVVIMPQSENEVALGQEICAVSADLLPRGGLQACVSTGIVSKTRVVLQDEAKNSQIFEVDANITADGMGGIVIDNLGEMVGFVINGTSFGEGGRLRRPLVLSSSSFTDLTYLLISDYNFGGGLGLEDLEPLSTEGKSFYGLFLKNINERDLKEYNLSSAEGVLVEAIEPGSAGAKAGFSPGDLIIGAENYKVSNVAILRKIERRVRNKGQMSVVLSKNGRRRILILNLEGRKTISKNLPELSLLSQPTPVPEPTPKPTPKPAPKPAPKPIYKLDSISDSEPDSEIVVRSLSDAHREDLDFGVVISSIASGSAYRKAGLKEGDVIQEIQEVLVESKEQFERELAKVKKGDRVLFYVVHADGSYGYVTADL